MAARLETLVALLIFLMTPVLFPHQANANTIYSYQGNQFTSFAGTYACPPECNITGSFEIAGPPQPNLVGSIYVRQFDVTPLNYSFSDGSVTLTPSNSSYDFFSIWTNGAGDIISWVIRLSSPACLGSCPNYTGIELLTTDNAPGTEDNVFNDVLGSFTDRAVTANPGTWTTVTPLPSSWTMMLIGFAALGFVSYRRNRKAVAACAA